MKKKVLMLGWEFPPSINGGLGVACQGLTEALDPHVDLTLILPEQNTLPPYPDSRTDKPDLYTGDLTSRILDYTRHAVQGAEQYHFDIIHAHDWMTFQAALEIQSRTHKPLVLHIHSLSYDRSGPETRDEIFELERRAMTKADSVITVSKYTKSICTDHYDITPTKIHSIHNGVAPIRKSRPPKRHSEKLVLFLGRMTRQKAPLNFLGIATRILNIIPDVRFVMAGTGDQLDVTIRKSLDIKINKHVQFPGFIDREKINDLFARSDVYCMPSVSEPFGLSALEAAQFGTPTVISKQSGALEVLTRSRSADHWDLDLFAKHIIELLTNDEAHNIASDHSFRDQLGFTWDRSAAQVMEVYSTLT